MDPTAIGTWVGHQCLRQGCGPGGYTGRYLLNLILIILLVLILGGGGWFYTNRTPMVGDTYQGFNPNWVVVVLVVLVALLLLGHHSHIGILD